MFQLGIRRWQRNDQQTYQRSDDRSAHQNHCRVFETGRAHRGSKVGQPRTDQHPDNGCRQRGQVKPTIARRDFIFVQQFGDRADFRGSKQGTLSTH